MSDSAESPLGPVSEILLAWEERRQRGESVGADELCRDHPELAEEVARRIRILESVYRIPNQATPTDDRDCTDVRTSDVPPRVPGYEVLELIGSGGMGVVYKVRHQRLHRLCALKMIRYDGPTGPMERARFRTEAEAIAALQHPNIVQLYEVGEVGRSPFLVLEYVEGPTLAERIRFGSISTQDAAGVVHTLAEAVEYAHGRGIIHRDLKPGNILLSFSREREASEDSAGALASRSRLNELFPKITDFGLAKRLPGTASVVTDGPHTATGAVFGTPAYMAPEQALGHTRGVGPAADVYSLGAILYELLTGRPPFQAESVLELLDQVRSMEPVSPRRLRPQLPGDLDTICLKCLQKEPAKRYASAAALGDDLRRYLNGQPIRARRVAMSERAWRWCRRNPVIAGLTTAVAAALVIGTVVASVLAVWAFGERDRARLELGNSLVAQAAALQGTGQLGQRFVSLRLLGEAARELRNHPRAQERLSDIRNHAIAALSLTDLKITWERAVGSVIGSHFDSKLERYTIVDYAKTGKVFVRSVEDNHDLLESPHPKVRFWYTNTDFSPDGQYLLACYWLEGGKGALLHVWHIDRKELVFAERASPGGDLWLTAVIHPNGRWLVYARADDTLAIWDLVEQREIRRFPLNAAAYSIGLDPTGERVAVTEHAARRIRILDLDSGEERSAWRSENGVGALAWSADGQVLASSGGLEGRASIWHVPRGEQVAVLHGHTAAVTHLQFAHSGHLLATASWDRTTRLWDAIAGESLVTAPGTFRRFSADDRRVAFLDGTNIGVWELTHGLDCRTFHPGLQGALAPEKDFVYGASFGADGRLLTAGDNSGVRLWDLATGAERAHLQMGVSIPSLFHPEGHAMITHCAHGTYHWPMRVADGPIVETIRIGPPEQLPIIHLRDNGWQDAKWMPGHVGLAVNDRANSRILIYDLQQPDVEAAAPAELRSQHRRVISISVSPDGKWLAAGAWKEDGIQIWNVLERRLLEPVLRISALARRDFAYLAYFSPDGRWLVSATMDELGSYHGYHFWRPGTWELERFIPAKLCHNRAAFSDDGRVLAMTISPQQILLADPTDGREIARLSTLQPIGPWPAAFSPDGTKLAAITGRRTVLVWDLRRIRDQLAEMGLDWDAPAFPATAQDFLDKPLRVQVIGEVPSPETPDP